MLRMTPLLTLTALLVTVCAFAAELDPGYVNSFGWGNIAVSERGFPAKDKFDASMYTYSEGKFMVSPGAGTQLNLRSLLKQGKTYGQYVSALKQANKDKMKTYTEDYARYTFWASHDFEGKQIFDVWPTKLGDLPKWALPLFKVETGLTTGMAWNGSACSWQEMNEASGKLQMFLERAQPGWKVYVINEAGFVRTAPELKYWDRDQLRYVTPIQYVSTGPLAACTIEVAAAAE